jgi:tape measure domain-containing protein
MAKLGDLIVKIGADTRSLNTELGKIQRKIKNTADNIQGLGQSMSMGLTLPVAGLGLAAVKAAADLQTMETQFVSLTGGAEQAGQMVDKLNQFAAATPYEIEGIASAARQLIAAGTDVNDVTNQLQYLGDIAAVSGVPIEEMASIFAKVQAKGKVELENLNQLAERGIPIFTMLSEATGLLPSELGAGAVSVDLFNQTLMSMAQEGGFAFGAMENLSQTAAGKFSTAMDGLKMAAASLGEVLLPIATAVIDKVTELAAKFEALDMGTKKMLVVFGAIAGAIGPALIGFALVSKGMVAIQNAASLAMKGIQLMNASLLTNPYTAIAVAVAALVALIITNWDEIKAYFTDGDGSKLWDELVATFDAAVAYIKELWSFFLEFLEAFWDRFGGSIMTTIDTVMDTVMGIVRGALGFLKGIFSAGTALLKGDWDGFLTGIIDATVSIMQAIVNTFLGGVRQLANGVDTLLNAVGIDSAVGPWIEGLQSKAYEYFDSIKSGADTAKDSVDDMNNAVQDVDTLPPVPVTPKPTMGKGKGKGKGTAKSSEDEEIDADAFKTTFDDLIRPVETKAMATAAFIAALPDTLDLEEIAEPLDEVFDDVGFDQVMFDQFVAAEQAAMVFKDNMANIMADIATNATALGGQFGAAFGQLLTGAEGGEEAMASFASSALDAGFQAATALAINAAGQTAAAAGPGAAIALPILITAGMALIRSTFQGITGFADGGIISGPTMGLVGEYPGAKSNPEVIAPLDKLRSMISDVSGGGHVVVTGRISGRDILISNERTSRDAKRFR